MRVLLTNNTLAGRAGTELYIRDVALELLRRGHHPVAYSTVLGEVAEELRAATVPVIRSLESLGEPPNIIHGHHHYDTLSAMMWFPQTPAVSFCHGWLPWEEAPLRFPRIRRYVAVDEVCRERLTAEGGVAPEKIEVILNFFNENEFPPRPPLPPRPRRALVFSNTFSEAQDLPVLRESCRQSGTRLDVMGMGAGNPEARPGPLLAMYDIVFAKGRAAIEAMAVGTAVILCDPGRLGPMVTSRNFASLRPLNFGVRTLSRKLTLPLIVAEIERYDAADAAAVSMLVRENCELKPAVDRILRVYEKAIADARSEAPPPHEECDRAAARYLESFACHHKHSALAEDRLRWIERCFAAEEALRAEREGTEDAGPSSPSARPRQDLPKGDPVRTSPRGEPANANPWDLLIERDRELAHLRHDLAQIRASATWRWTQQVLRRPLIQRLFGGLIRSVAARSRRVATG